MNKNLLDQSWHFSTSTTLGDLLTFSLPSVNNLYKIDENNSIFKFEHKDGEYLAMANLKIELSPPIFEATYSDSHSTEYGITYVGIIQISFGTNSYTILVPADKSYDPAGKADKVWVESRQINKLLVFVCVLITAARYGARSKFIRRLFKVMSPIIEKYYEKKFLFRWMYEQVKLACLKKKQPMSYTDFINSHVKADTRQYCEDVELVRSGKIERVSIPEEYSVVLRSSLRNAQEAENDEGEIAGTVDIMPQCFSPDIDEDEVPNIQEIQKDLSKVKERYESELKTWLKKIGELKGCKKAAPNIFAIEKTFEIQCPVF